MPIEIVPYCSVGKIKFGLTEEDVKNILGKPNGRRGDTLEWSSRLLYFQMTIDFDKITKKFYQVHFDSNDNPTIKINDVIFELDNELNQKLINLNYKKIDIGDSLVYLELGVCVSKDIDDPVLLTVFEKGRFDWCLKK